MFFFYRKERKEDTQGTQSIIKKMIETVLFKTGFVGYERKRTFAP
jgi:hypothetical protein